MVLVEGKHTTCLVAAFRASLEYLVTSQPHEAQTPLKITDRRKNLQHTDMIRSAHNRLTLIWNNKFHLSYIIKYKLSNWMSVIQLSRVQEKDKSTVHLLIYIFYIALNEWNRAQSPNSRAPETQQHLASAVGSFMQNNIANTSNHNYTFPFREKMNVRKLIRVHCIGQSRHYRKKAMTAQSATFTM